MHSSFTRLLLFALALLIFLPGKVRAEFILIPMDSRQTDHLKAYGIAFWVIKNGGEVDWLLNYRGGSFMFTHTGPYENELRIRDVSYERISDGQSSKILMEVTSENANMDAMKLEKAPKVAVYSPKNKQPWDDAVTLALTYAEIPYDVVYDEEVLDGKLKEYDWLHLHHEDFTGQYGKFYAAFHTQQWYKDQVAENEGIAAKYKFSKVSQLKLAVSLLIREFVNNGGFLFAMCSATDSYDIALASQSTDICDVMFDGDPADPDAQSKLDFNQTFAFTDFNLIMNPFYYEFSNIDMDGQTRQVPKDLDYFSLFEFSAKWDPVPTMLCQNHTQTIKGFMGQTTAFNKNFIRNNVFNTFCINI